MKFKILDALPGAGKTTACINMINAASSEKKFIFITPYKPETERIKTNCPEKNFCLPVEKKVKLDNGAEGYNKLESLHELLRSGSNIASTHSLFANFTDETKQLLNEQEYTLILDEVVDLFKLVSKEEIDEGDIEFAIRKNTFSANDDGYVLDDPKYTGKAFRKIARESKSKTLVRDVNGNTFWKIRPDLFMCFDDGYVLTYMFESSLLKPYFDIYGIEYELIGVRRDVEPLSHYFCFLSEMDRRVDLTGKIHILHDSKLNSVGQGFHDLSNNWFENKASPEELKELKDNIYNAFRNKFDGKGKERMWTTFKDNQKDLKGKGYIDGFVVFNKRATNDYKDKKYLAYCLNVFLHPWKIDYLRSLGAQDIDFDLYALSQCLQWIFRSAIREGNEIWIFIPSRRMRTLLEQWLINLKNGEDLKPIKINKKIRGDKSEK